MIFPLTGHGIAEVKSFHGVGKIAHEVAATEFAIGEDAEAKVLLFFEDAQDVAIFQFLKILCGDLGMAGFQQFNGP